MAEKKLTSLKDLMKELNIPSDLKSESGSDDESPPPPPPPAHVELHSSDHLTKSDDLSNPPLATPGSNIDDDKKDSKEEVVKVEEEDEKKVVVVDDDEREFLGKNKVKIYAKKNTSNAAGESSGYESFCGGWGSSSMEDEGDEDEENEDKADGGNATP